MSAEDADIHSDAEIIAAVRAAQTVPRGQINYDLLGYALSEFAWGGPLDALLEEVERLGGAKIMKATDQ